MHPIPIFVGFVAFAVVVAAGLLFRSWTAPKRCPECGAGTVPTTPDVRLPRAIEVRWCGHCGWEGVGRRGPAFDPEEGPVHHASGFRWSRGIRPDAPRFAWKEDLPAPEPEPPEGFTWRPLPPEPPRPRPPASPVEAFDWADPEERGFRWGDREPPSSEE